MDIAFQDRAPSASSACQLEFKVQSSVLGLLALPILEGGHPDDRATGTIIFY